GGARQSGVGAATARRRAVSGVVSVGPPAQGLRGTATVPGDKSIAHRAVLLGALAEGMTRVENFPAGADTLSTLGAVRALGARADHASDVVVVDGAGPALGDGARGTIDCGNSGTTMRLGAGLAAGAHGTVVLDGDASLRRRPMERVAEPLRRMGADVATADGRPPVTIRGGALTAIDWTMPVSSAQVKSAILLAALRARGTTRVREAVASRDHTERLLPSFGVSVTREPGGVALVGGARLRATTVPLPGDASSAAFLVVAALLVPGSELRLTGVGVNPTRRRRPDESRWPRDPRRRRASAVGWPRGVGRRPSRRDGVRGGRARRHRRCRDRGPGLCCGLVPGLLRPPRGPRRKGGRVTQPLVVAVDGPAGAGKSTASRALARRLGFSHLD